MDGSTLLLIHNIGYVIDSALLVALIVLVFFKGRSRSESTLFILAIGATLVFAVSHVIGVNIADPYLSRDVLMFNAVAIPLSPLFAHFTFAVIGKLKEQRWPLVAMYAVSAALVVLYMLFPETFLLPSAPKLYFPDYYVAGNLQWIMRIVTNVLIPAYFLAVMLLSYRSADPILRNRIKYLAGGLFAGFFFGFFAVPLVFTPDPTLWGFVIDPVWSVLFVPLFAIPFAYAALKYELIDIRIVAKQALGYFVLIEGVGVVISLLLFFSDYIRESLPYLPVWILPIVFSIIFVSIGAMIWRRLSETDVLKYEFITVVTHKFRTPLTRIKWAAEDITPAVPAEMQESVATILESERQLLDLTDILVRLSDADVSRFDYHPRPLDTAAIFAGLSAEYASRAAKKGVAMTFAAQPGLSVMADAEKSPFLFQILLDNALNYTPSGGSIRVRSYSDADGKGKHGVIEVADTGIGMSRETAARVFKRFYRGDNARHADTEGMGIGLFMAKSIAEKQGGRIWVESAGEGKGSTFSLRLPLPRSMPPWSKRSASAVSPPQNTPAPGASARAAATIHSRA